MPYRIMKPGRNCWRMADARRASVLTDAAAYFTRLEQALRLAERSIFIVGWDFDAAIKLAPADNRDRSMALGDLLRAQADKRPDLEIRVLIWSLATVHAPGASPPMIFGAPWQDHPRIKLCLDRNHPLYAAHHQKLVCIDDALAFGGGIDLSVERWDTSQHAAEDLRRRDPDGTSYAPVHDLQMVVDGEAARAAAELARERWHHGTGEEVAALPAPPCLWPPGLEPDFEDVQIAIARTMPGWGDSPTIHEVAALTEDALRSARRSIYIEAQYLTGRRIREALAESLARPEGPEVVAVVTQSANGLIERFFMSANRERLIRRLKQADRHGRFRVYFPVVPHGDGEREIFIHAKLMIVDDVLLRVGSANLNNRSMGLDTECDFALEARDDETRQAIARICARLLAEHLDARPQEIAAALAKGGSLIGVIERFNTKVRGLRPLMDEVELQGPIRSFPGTRFVDPEVPFVPFKSLRGCLWSDG